MSTVVKTRIIKIGNSQGIRIPKILLDQTSLGKEVELELQQGQIIVRSAYRARHNWEDQFKPGIFACIMCDKAVQLGQEVRLWRIKK